MPKELTEVVKDFYTRVLIIRLDGRTPPEIMLITSLIVHSEITLTDEISGCFVSLSSQSE